MTFKDYIIANDDDVYRYKNESEFIRFFYPPWLQNKSEKKKELWTQEQINLYILEKLYKDYTNWRYRCYRKLTG